ncbi:unnamed protein product [Lactuca virosa]|uniref:Uncharacterized protein n=1 Tax=Lactuca virosa TaxID=75947 RepID=A0AAU9MQM8_9ASTR|nr:unnamed protein product [Lactuca virosa]
MSTLVFISFLSLSLLLVCEYAESNFSDSLDMLEDKSLKIEDDSDLPSWSVDKHGVRVLMNVDSFGAVGEGVSDDTKAFGHAWKEAFFTDCIHGKQCNI